MFAQFQEGLGETVCELVRFEDTPVAPGIALIFAEG